MRSQAKSNYFNPDNDQTLCDIKNTVNENFRRASHQ